MNQSQRELRRAAAQAFAESLEQLEIQLAGSLESHEVQTPPIPATPSPVPAQAQKLSQAQKPQQRSPITFSELEEAVADIEQFTKERTEDATPNEEQA